MIEIIEPILSYAVIDPLIGGALIAGAASLLGGLFGSSSNKQANLFNLQATRETNAANMAIANAYNQNQLELAKTNYNLNLDQWRRENEYNSAAAIMQRYKQAGLNPNLIYGHVGGNLAGASPQIEMPNQVKPNIQAPHIQPYQGWQQLGSSVGNIAYDYVKKKAEIENIKADTDKKNADAGKSRAETNVLNADYEKARFELDNGIWQRNVAAILGINEQRVKNLAVECDEMNQRIQESLSRIELNNAEIDVKMEQVKVFEQQVKVMIDDNARAWKLNSAQCAQLSAIAGYYIAKKNETQELTQYEVMKLKGEIDLLGKQGKLADDSHGMNVVNYTYQQLINTRTRLENKRLGTQVDFDTSSFGQFLYGFEQGMNSTVAPLANAYNKTK